MPKYRITSPDGVKYEITAPDGATQEQVLAYAQSQHKPQANTQPNKSAGIFDNLSLSNVPQNLGNLGAGMLRGAGSIGSTIIAPYDIAKDAIAGKPFKELLSSNDQRRAAIDAGLQSLGADPNSGLYKAGKIGAEIAGTADIGGVLGAGAKALGASKLANALKSGGLTLGAPPAASALSGDALANGLTRVAGGAGTGAASAAAIDPQSAASGAVIGGALPVVGKIAGETGAMINNGLDSAGHSLMQSALKPTLKQRQTGQADRAIQTLLDEGLNATKGGVEQLQSRIGDINNQIKTTIGNSNQTVDKQAVIDALNGTTQKFGNQVSPTNDLNAIQGIADDFKNSHAALASAIPVQQAQDLKQGTYSVLNGKYGETGSAATEAQKALARGLKEQIALAHPEIGALNSRESDLINALGVTERRAMLDDNKNPVGLAALAGNPIAAAGMLADRSALVKSLLARGSNALAQSTSNNADLAKALIEQATPKLVGVAAQ
jgi:hypothetical protein